MRIDGKILCIVLFLMLWYWKKTTFMYQWSIEYIHFLLRFKTIGERLVANFVSSSLKKRLLCLVFIRKRFSFTQVFQNYEMIKKDKWRNDIWKRAWFYRFDLFLCRKNGRDTPDAFLKRMSQNSCCTFLSSRSCCLFIVRLIWHFESFLITFSRRLFIAQLKKHLLESYSKTRSKL